MKEFRYNILLAALLLFVRLIIPERFVLPYIVCACILYAMRVSYRSSLILLLLCACSLIPLHETGGRIPETARVTEVHESWCILQSGRKQMLFYCDGPLLYDTEISLDGSLEDIESSRGFFRFDFSKYLSRRGIYKQYVTDEVTVSGFRSTMRRFLQEKTESFEDPLLKAFLYRTVFGISNDELLSGSLMQSGFSFAAVLFLLEALLKRFVKDRHRKIICINFNCFLIVFYGPRLVLVSSLIRRSLSFCKLEKQEISGIWIILMILLFHEEVLSAAFLIPAVFMVSSLAEKNDSFFIRWTGLAMVQGVLYQKFSPLQSLFFPFYLRINGFLWLYGLLVIFFPFLACGPLIAIISELTLVSEKICIPGSPIGLGLPFFVILALSFYRNEYAAKIITGLYFSFLLTGLFHPFAEVTFINVGQGDSILIREPFNLNNVLIDTGKPSQYKVLKAMLEGKGIRKLDTMFITHMDSDHSGNMDVISEEYKARRVIKEHEGTTLSGSLVFHDLNSLDTEDENRNSIVLVFEMNGLKFVMPGDADQITEETIVRKYGNLTCDVLKLSHHGSKTGSCDLFLDTLKPELGIVSAGAWQIYHHPSDETVQRLLKRHIPYLDTKDHGDISIVMIGPLSVLITSDGIVDVLSSPWQG